MKKGKYEERVDAQGDKYYIQTEEFEVDSKAQVDGYRAELDASLDAKQMDTVINAMDSFMSIMKNRHQHHQLLARVQAWLMSLIKETIKTMAQARAKTTARANERLRRRKINRHQDHQLQLRQHQA